MKRRELLSGLFALSAAGFVSGCHGSEMPDDDKSKTTATLKVIFQGPFAVVLKKKDERFTVSAFIPPDRAHEFRFQTPMSTSVEKSALKYHFTLESEGLDITGRYPYIDHGFDDMFFNLGKYPEPDYFVSVDLPAPDLITFIPPSEPVVFAGGKVVFAPLNHVLEYKITNRSKVVLHSDQLKEKNQRPLAFSEIFRQYEEHGKKEQDYEGKTGHGPQFPRTKDELSRPVEPEVYTYFFGVGVQPNTKSPLAAAMHGLEFFNNKLVPLFPNARDLKPLVDIRNYGDPCTPVLPQGKSSEKPSVLRDSMQQPRLLLVTSAEDCRAVGISGCSGC